MKHLLQLTCFVFVCCSEDPINNTCADPIGTDNYTLTVGAPYSCMEENLSSCFRLEVNSGIPYFRSTYRVTPSDAPMIKDMGEFGCLRQVVEQPKSGLVYLVEAKLHHGYAFKLSNGTYGRVFIDSWETNSGTVARVNITRQYSY